MCLIPNSDEGVEILRIMLENNTNRQFAWPSILGCAATLSNFWMGRDPHAPSPEELENAPELTCNMENLSLAPLRMISIENGTVVLAADMR